MFKGTGVCSRQLLSPALSTRPFLHDRTEPLASSWSVSGIFLARAESNCLADASAQVPQRLPVPGLISALRPHLTLGQTLQGPWDKMRIPQERLDVIIPKAGHPAKACWTWPWRDREGLSDTTGVGAGSGPHACAALSCRRGTRLAPPRADGVDNLALTDDSPACHPRKNFPVSRLVLCRTSRPCTL